jgi:hypothetical protein
VQRHFGIPEFERGMPVPELSPTTDERVNVRYGWHLVTNCHKAKQGNKSSVESILIHYFNT